MIRLPEFQSNFEVMSNGTMHINQEPVVSICYSERFEDYELAIISDDTETYGYSEFNGYKTDVLSANPTHGFDLDRLVDEIRRIYLLANV